MSKSEYKEKFLDRQTITADNWDLKPVMLDPKVLQIVKRIASISGIKMGSYVNNIITDHFENYRPELLRIIRANLRSLDIESYNV